MVWAAYMSLPLSLADTGAVLGPPGKAEAVRGAEGLIRYFCKACEPARPAADAHATAATQPEKWELFKAYNRRDVETKMEIEQRLARFPVPEDVWDQFHIDQGDQRPWHRHRRHAGGGTLSAWTPAPAPSLRR